MDLKYKRAGHQPLNNKEFKMSAIDTSSAKTKKKMFEQENFRTVLMKVEHFDWSPTLNNSGVGNLNNTDKYDGDKQESVRNRFGDKHCLSSLFNRLPNSLWPTIE